MTQQLGALATLPEAWVGFLYPAGNLQPSVTLVAGDLMPTYGLLRVLHACGVQRSTQAKYPHTLNKNK